jgi:small subunit ribosomal protein S14
LRNLPAQKKCRLLESNIMAIATSIGRDMMGSVDLRTLNSFMAKKSMIEREKRRKKMVEKYAAKRQELKEKFDKATSQLEKMEIHRQIQQLPRNSAPNRVRNRCWLTGRPRAYYRDFGLSRNAIREMAHEGLLPGVVKSSW